MKIVAESVKTLTLVSLLSFSVNSQSASITDFVTVDGTDWAQPADFTNLSWNDIDAVCPESAGGVCGAAAMLNGFDLDGWVWASVEEVGALFLDPSWGPRTPPAPNNTVRWVYREAGSVWAPAFLGPGAFTPTDCCFNPTATAQARGWTRTTVPNRNANAYFPAVVDQHFDVDEDVESTADHTTKTFSRTVNGMWLYRATNVSVAIDIDIKFCSDPNAFNCRKKGVLPVTIFGTASFDVSDIDPSTLRLCLTDGTTCTNAPTNWSIADRGDPTSDLGASMCAVHPTTGMELDFLNLDGYPDFDAAFDAREVQALLGVFCSGMKNGVSPTLIIIGSTNAGTPFSSAPIGSTGIDQLVKKGKK